MRTPSLATSNCAGLFGLLTTLLIAACVERPPSAQQKRLQYDRAKLSDIVSRAVPTSSRRVGAVFGGSVELLGVDFTPVRPNPGDTVEVTFFYRVLEEVDEDYKVFVHIETRGESGGRVNGDHWPARGRYPTTAWRRGEVIRDRWTFRAPSGATASEGIELWTGFYVPGKDQRWPLSNRTDVQHDGQNRVLAATIR